MVPHTCQSKKFQVDRERKDTEQSTMFSENIIILSCCTIIKMPSSRVDKFSVGRTKCMSPMQIRTWWNSPALFLLVNYKEYLNHALGLTLSTPGLVVLSVFLVQNLTFHDNWKLMTCFINLICFLWCNKAGYITIYYLPI